MTTELPSSHALLLTWQQRLAELNLVADLPPAIQTSLPLVWQCSQFVAEQCLRKPEMLLALIQSEDLLRQYDAATYLTRCSELTVNSEDELMYQLRRLRNREMVRIAWRDLAGWAELSETLMDLSLLAEACIQTALTYLYQQATAKRGTPLLSDGSPQQLIVLGMGKLGAYELNFSSDIDLILAYAEDGALNDRKSTSYGEFFTKVGQQLVKVLSDTTSEGFVFRTDLRLRPFGDSGALVMSFDGMEHYYLTQAREWERYAMIKARQVAGDVKTGAQLMAMLHAFVYRRYLDYGTFEELRLLKAQITQELQRKDRLDNIKLGPGGIREIEFIGQAFQLIRGGKEKRLQHRSILTVLNNLGELNLLSATDVKQLTDAYGFLRRAENHIQQYQDKQTHDLPNNDATRHVLALSMGYEDWQAFSSALEQIRRHVHSIFADVFSLAPESVSADAMPRLEAIGEGELGEKLQALGFAHPESSLGLLNAFKQSPKIKRLSTKGAIVLDKLLPKLLSALSAVTEPDETLKRVLGLLEAIAGRTVYLSLLVERPDALTQLLRLTSASPWLCDLLARSPILLDELLDSRSLYEPLTKPALESALSLQLSAMTDDDLERLMTLLREFKQVQVLRVAAADIIGVIPLMVVSDYLTYIAETVVNEVVARSWQLLVNKHGYPPNTDDNTIGFAVIGFGKLGGIELGYASDLDLVFLYDCDNGLALTNGDKPIPCGQFYGRLGQKVRHILDTKLLSGVLYEVDMRLRPSGDSGLLVAHVDTYEQYQREQAWTWEHQALVRGRFIAGDNVLGQAFTRIRHRILSLERDYDTLKTDVRTMREKMREALAVKEAGQFDLKHSKGGIADIEFIVQFGVLALSARYPELTEYTDTMRLLSRLNQVGFLSSEATALLQTAYVRYRDNGHKLVLQGGRTLVDALSVTELSTAVVALWQQLME